MGTVIVTPGVPETVEVTQDVASTVDVLEQSPSTVEVASVGVQGIPGPAGATGPQGPTGPAGTTDHLLLSNIGTRTHAQLETDIAAKEPLLPSQSGQAGKFLTTDGANKSWGTVTAPVWGAITGTLASQTDLQTALDNKVTKNANITGATKTKITYDAKGLVTSGADATTADIADSLNKRYVTDADLIDIGNLSGINSGNQTIALTGDVNGSGTGSFTATVQKTVITGKPIAAPSTSDYVLFSDASDSSNLKSTMIGDVLNLAGSSVYVPYTGATTDINLNSRDIKMDSGTIKDAGGFDSFASNNRALITAAGIPNVQWGTYELADSGAIVTANWDTKLLIYNGVSLLSWDGALSAFDSLGIPSAQFNSRELYDSSVLISVNWQTRELFDAGGSFPSINWANYQLLNIGVSSSVPMLDWSSGAGGSVKIYDGFYNVVVGDFTNRHLNDSSGNTSVDWGARYLYDNTFTVSVDWDYHTLNAPYGQLSINWESRVAFYSTGYVSINYNNGLLYGDYSWSLPTVDYGNNFYLRDSTNVLSLKWDARTIINSYNSVLLSWFDEALVMGGSQYASNGAIWADATQKAFGIYHAGVSQTIQSALFTQIATGTRANSTSEGNISSTGIGTLSLPTNFFVSGKTLRVSGRGFHSSTASPTLNLKVKFGSTVISTTGAHTHHNATNGYFEFDTFITCRTTGASGTVFAQGKMFDATDIVPMGSTATVTVNTTTTQEITVTAQWSAAAAGNTISLTNLIVEVVN